MLAGVDGIACEDSRVTRKLFDAILVAPGKLPRHIPAAFGAN